MPEKRARGLMPVGGIRRKEPARLVDDSDLSVPFTKEVRRRFLQKLEADVEGECAWTPWICARKCGVSRGAVLWAIERDADFKAAWEDLRRRHAENLEKAAHERAVVGVEEDVYGSLGPGMGTGVVGTRVVYDNKLLLRLLERHSPEWRPSHRVETQVTEAGVHDGITLAQLPPEVRERLKALLRGEVERRKQADVVDVQPG